MTVRRRRLRAPECLESRKVFAFAEFEFNLYGETETGALGAPLSVDEVQVGDSFYVEIRGKENDPDSRGLRAVSLNVHWDPTVLEVIESDFILNEIITANLPEWRSGDLEKERGGIYDLTGMAVLSAGAGRAIGDGEFERFAVIHFKALATANETLLRMFQGGSSISPVPAAILSAPHLDFEVQKLRVVPALTTSIFEPPTIFTQSIDQTPPPTSTTSSTTPTPPVTTASTSNNVTPNATLPSTANTNQVQLTAVTSNGANSSVAVGSLVNVNLLAQDQRTTSLGVSGLSVNVNWDPTQFELVLPASGKISDTIASQLPLMRSGVADANAGRITNLSASSLPNAGMGSAIGKSNPELFATLQFRALKASANASIRVSQGSNGIGLIDADNGPVSLMTSDAAFKIIESTGQPQISVRLPTASGNAIEFGTQDSSGQRISSYVRPSLPDRQNVITLTNTGTAPLVVQKIDSAVPNVQIEGTQFPLSISPGGNAQVRVVYAPSKANPSNAVPESFQVEQGLVIHSNATNQNRYGIRLIGKSTFDADLTYDGSVDLADMARFDSRFGTSDPLSDPNGDGRIDFGDLGLMNAQFGKRIETTAGNVLLTSQTQAFAPLSATASAEPDLRINTDAQQAPPAISSPVISSLVVDAETVDIQAEPITVPVDVCNPEPETNGIKDPVGDPNEAMSLLFPMNSTSFQMNDDEFEQMLHELALAR